jgi:hypothetical protein
VLLSQGARLASVVHAAPFTAAAAF